MLLSAGPGWAGEREYVCVCVCVYVFLVPFSTRRDWQSVLRWAVVFHYSFFFFHRSFNRRDACTFLYAIYTVLVWTCSRIRLSLFAAMRTRTHLEREHASKQLRLKKKERGRKRRERQQSGEETKVSE